MSPSVLPSLSPSMPLPRRNLSRPLVMLVLAAMCSLALWVPTTAVGAARLEEEPVGQDTVVDGEQDVVESIQEDFEEDGDGVDVLAISALVAGLLGMLMGGVALSRTNRLVDSPRRD